MMIPREIVEEIVTRSDITEVIGSYVNLKRAGSNMNGLCPFHSEKTPSFTVFTGTNSFYCFGCGAGGDVVTFIMKAENLDYPSALELLASRVGITIPQTADKTDGGISRKRVYEMNVEAAKYFRNCLFDEQLGVPGREYLMGKRKLSLTTIKHFGLGYAPNNFSGLLKHMKKLGYTDDELVTCFLCGKSQKNGALYDYFRNRVMFPIIDVTGNIIAFGGRVLDDSKPKYLNSSDTPGFKKSKNLFALNYAKNHCAENLILCEGYMDVIALHEAGFENAVATLGTALTSEQARMFTKYTKKVILSYDSDSAGQNATDRALKILSEVGMDARVLKLSGAKDPDEYIRKFGKDKFKAVLGESNSGFDFKLNGVLSKYHLEIPEEKIKATKEICEVIAEIYSPIEREVYIGRTSEIVSIPIDVLKNNVDIIIRKKKKEEKKGEIKNAYLSIKNIGDKVNPEAVKFTKGNAAEEGILGMMLLRPDLRTEILNGKIALSIDDFVTAFGKKVFEIIVEEAKANNEISYAVLDEKFSPDEMGRIERMKQNRLTLSSEENNSEVLLDFVNKLKEEKSKVVSKTGEDKFSFLRKRREEIKNKKDNI